MIAKMFGILNIIANFAFNKHIHNEATEKSYPR